MDILIVDDSETSRGIVKTAIKDNAVGQHEYSEAANGEEAFTIIGTKNIDIIFLDWNMPVMDGLEVTKRIRGEGRNTPIVMITAETDDDKIMEATKAGISTYIEKPIRGIELWEEIKEFVN